MDLACWKPLETMYVSYIKCKKTVQKFYKHDICGGQLGFSLYVHFRQTIFKVVHLGCVREYI